MCLTLFSSFAYRGSNNYFFLHIPIFIFLSNPYKMLLNFQNKKYNPNKSKNKKERKKADLI